MLKFKNFPSPLEKITFLNELALKDICNTILLCLYKNKQYLLTDGITTF